MPEFKPMLAAKAQPSKLRFPLYVQAKLDGIRCSIVGGRPLTRTLKAIPNHEIRNRLSDARLEGFDGELIVGDPTAPDCYRKTASYVMSEDKTGGDWHFYVFDLWNHQTSFKTRTAVLAASIEPLFAWSSQTNVVYVSAIRCLDAVELERVESEYVKLGHEGVILRSPDAYYKFGRASATTGELLKLKRFEDFESTVIGVYEEQHNGNVATTNALGRSERSSAAAGKTGKETLGGLILKRSDGSEFRCGTGFDARTRQALWAERETLPGRVAVIKHFPIGAKDKPRFPVFKGWREALDNPANL